jgi:ADP-heptose:LPS heptosyltransferase
LSRRGVERFLHRRRFYGQIPRIVAARLRGRDRRPAVFVSMMGGIGDLVNAFPTIERLAAAYAVDLGTGAGACATLAAANPYLRDVYAPFVYKPIRRAHRQMIERALAPFYRRVILLDEPDSTWRRRDRHMSAVYAERCGCAPPGRGAVYLDAAARARAVAWLRARGLDRFVYVTQLVRRSRPLRSWPLAHYHALCGLLRARLGLPVLVDTVGSDETAVPDGCVPLDRLDILTAAAIIERAHLYVGPDTGPTHVAAALGVPTLAIHVGYPPEVCRALGDNVLLVRQARPLDDPARVTPEQVAAALDGHRLVEASAS